MAFFFLKDSGKTAEPEAAAPAAEAAKEDEAPKPAEEKAPEAKPSEEKAPEAPKQAEEKAPEAPQAGAAAPTPAPEAAPSAHSAGATPREKVRTFFANPGRTAKAAMELAKELEIKTQDDAEAQFRLHYFAANNDEASAYVPYARALDPSQPAVGSVKKDPADARVFYEKAGDTASVEAMKKFIDERAAAGDKDAKAWQSQLK
jgi:ribonuclease E